MFGSVVKKPYHLVQELNQEIHESEQYTDQYSEFTLLEYRTNGYVELILFFGEQIWSSDDDDREYYEEIDEYESLDTYLRRKVNEVIRLIYTIELQEEVK